MGKAKKTKKSNSRVAATPSKEQSQLEAELGSLEESKRIRACKVLVDLYATNATKNNSSATLSSLTSSAILSTLSMRLVDFSAEVRKLAIEAVSSLCCSSDAQILERIVNSGLFRSVAALVMDSSAMAGNGLDTHVLYPQLLVAIANIVQVYPTATNEINDLMSQLIEFLFSKLAAGSSAFYQNTIDTALSLLEALASSNTELARLILSHPYLDTVRTVAGQTAERVAAVVGSISTLDTIKTEDFDADYLRELLGAVKSSSLLLSLFFGAYEAKQSNSLCNSCCVEQQMSLVNSTVTLVVALICKLGKKTNL